MRVDELATSPLTKLSPLHTFIRYIFPLLLHFQLPSCWILTEFVEVSISVVFQVALEVRIVCCPGSCCPRVPEVGAHIVSSGWPGELQVLSINPTTQIVPLSHHWIDSSLQHLLRPTHVAITNLCHPCWIFLGCLNVLTALRMFLLHITWPYFFPLLPGWYCFLLSSTTAICEKIITSNASKCLANFFFYIALITLFLSALFFFPVILLYGIYTWHEIYQFVWLFSKSSSHKHRKQLAEIFSKHSPSGFLLSATHKKKIKLERSESNLSGKWNKCSWRKKICVWGHLYQTIEALVMCPGRVHALIKQIKQWDFELVPSGYNFYWQVQWVMWHLLCTNDEQHFHVHKQGDFANRCMATLRI